ncbi:hypothetical protein C8J57DRAFT_259619 [Mycena rebaudengoi]|nr:hypothetical protein C8J57DRAFT_259619 [Mycena rebaudengoi]
MTTDIAALTAVIIASVIHRRQEKGPDAHFVGRARVEWSWGLASGGLEEHLSTFEDPVFAQILMDQSLDVLPQREVIQQIRRGYLKTGPFTRTHIQCVYQGRKSFDYIILPVDPSTPVPPRMLSSELPPHLAVCTTCSNLTRRWARLTGYEFKPVVQSIMKLAKACADPSSIPDFEIMDLVFTIWYCASPPRSFLGLELEEDPRPTPKQAARIEEPQVEEKSSAESELESWASSYEEPQRRLLSCEGGAHDPDNEGKRRFFTSADGRDGHDDDDDALSFESHIISGIEDPKEHAQKDRDKPIRKFLKRIASWVEGTSSSGDELLVNDDQILQDPKELPCVVSGLDLSKPDYQRVLQSRKRRKTLPKAS